MSSNKNNENLTEDKTEKIIRKFYEKKRWTVEEEARGNEHGPDLVFRKKSKKMIIEVKGMPTPKHGWNAQKNGWFGSAFYEICKRMKDRTNHSKDEFLIAFPYGDKYKRLWDELPIFVKSKLKIKCLFVYKNGDVKKLSK